MYLSKALKLSGRIKLELAGGTSDAALFVILCMDSGIIVGLHHNSRKQRFLQSEGLPRGAEKN